MKEQIIEIIKNNSPEDAAKEILKLSLNLSVSGSLPSKKKVKCETYCGSSQCMEKLQCVD